MKVVVDQRDDRRHCQDGQAERIAGEPQEQERDPDLARGYSDVHASPGQRPQVLCCAELVEAKGLMRL